MFNRSQATYLGTTFRTSKMEGNCSTCVDETLSVIAGLFPHRSNLGAGIAREMLAIIRCTEHFIHPLCKDLGIVKLSSLMSGIGSEPHSHRTMNS